MLSLLLAPPAQAQDGDPVLPYRPSVASPAQLPAPGQLEFEAGGLLSKTDGARRASLPYTFKLAFSPEWGILLEGEAFVRARDETGRRETGVGDTTVVLKRAFVLDSATALGLELGWKAPTAKDAIGSGKSDLSLNGIFSRDLGAVHMDMNLNATRLGASEPGTGTVQTGWAASFSTPVSTRWGATAEVSGTRLRGAPATAQLLLAATYSPTPRLAIDLGVARGLTGASPDWSLFSGLVVPLGKLW
ncbi:transporter [Janthinobacterium sp. SUN118]|uniref:transporter n=1 Tax=Janthinobacterium sp. SUN118 TaxID=3004100 RepID=UPI0025AF0A10|nr:transporter [Janthinobacterium sp. SUN118]MDN2709444.1 transporter [Janthinobacterium sp. SUN118]